MTRFQSRYGWLLYANPGASVPFMLSGDARDFEINMERPVYGPLFTRFKCELSGAQMRRGGPLESLMWDALQSWHEPGVKEGRKWPPEMRAMLELARRHPEEYADLVTEGRRIPLQSAWKPESAEVIFRKPGS